MKSSLDSISKKASAQEQKELSILQKVFLGDLYSKQIDNLNHESSKLYEEAAILAASTKNKALQIWVYSQTGFYFYTYNQYETALPFFIKSSRLIDNIPDTDLTERVETLKKMPTFSERFWNTKKASNT